MLYRILFWNFIFHISFENTRAIITKININYLLNDEKYNNYLFCKLIFHYGYSIVVYLFSFFSFDLFLKIYRIYSTAIKRPYISVRYRFIPVQFYRRKSFVINRLNFGEISVKFRSYFGAKYRNYNNEFCTDYFCLGECTDYFCFVSIF